MPAFNCEVYVAQAIESVLIQSYSNFELIIINDGSTDNTLSIINSFAARDPRILIINQKNSGKPAIPRNVGINIAQGKYICFLDADDFYHPDKIRSSVVLLDRYPEIAAAFNDMKFISKEGAEYEGSFLGNRDFNRLASECLTLIDGNVFFCSESLYRFMSTHFDVIHTNTIMIRNSILKQEKLVFPTDIAIGEDTEMWFRLTKGRKLVFIDEILSYYRQLETSITKNLEKWYSDPLITLTRNFQWGQDVFTENDVKDYRKRLSMAYFNRGYYYKSLSNPVEARKAYIQASRWHFSIRILSAFMKTFVPQFVANRLRSED